jgi:two-component system, NtrC family, nitrogen regulation response regulator GlnG
LFLDEIGDMPPPLQAKILRVLQEQQFERIGGNETIQTHVRVLAATNQDLPKLIAEGRFRKDLFYRLNTVTIQVPPLRSRLTDVAELAHHFLFKFNRELGMDLRGFAPEVLDRFQEYDWPGNVRELQSAIKQAMLNASGHLILPEFLAESLLKTPLGVTAVITDFPNVSALIAQLLPDEDGQLYDRVIAAVERVLFAQVLEYSHGNQGRACELLGLNRSTLRHRLRTLGLALDKVPVEAPKKELDDRD